MAEKNRIIDAIREINPTAAADWLAAFSVAELEGYHRRLMELIERVRRSATSSCEPALAGGAPDHDFY